MEDVVHGMRIQRLTEGGKLFHVATLMVKIIFYSRGVASPDSSACFEEQYCRHVDRYQGDKMDVPIFDSDGLMIASCGTGKVLKTNQRYADMFAISDSLIRRGCRESIYRQVTSKLIDMDVATSFNIKQIIESLLQPVTLIVPLKDKREIELKSGLIDYERTSARYWLFRDVTELRTLKRVNTVISTSNTSEEAMHKMLMVLSQKTSH